MIARPYYKYLSIFFLLFLLATAVTVYFVTRQEPYQPLFRLASEEVPLFIDDTDLSSLITCAERQAAYLKKQPPGTVVTFGQDQYPYHWLLQSIQDLLAKLQQSPGVDELNRFLQENYLVYQAGGRKEQRGRTMLVTGYYEPVFEGSLTRISPYLTPIYSPPDSLVTVSKSDKNNKRVGRYNDQNVLVDYWSRAEIETGDLLKEYELAYLKDPFDAFLLHVQGSGRIQFPDKSVKSVRFAGSNGLGYNSIGKLLVDEDIMPLAEVNIPAIRSYLQQHPEQQRRILHHNPRYIFFNWGKNNSGPVGSSGEVLTAGRSIAMDTASLPGGSIAFLMTQKPVIEQTGSIAEWVPMNRFVFPQDSGAAIKGTGRVDVFWGNGSYAETTANHMKEEGKLFFLVKKGYLKN